MMFQEGCDFCEIVRKEEPARIVMRDQHVIAFFPTSPATLGHTLVVPTNHIPDIWALDDATATALTSATLRVARAVRAALLPEGLNIIQSNGAAATQTVQHLHVHVVPRWAGDPMGRIWPDEATSIQSTISEELRESEALRAIQDAIKVSE
ncbi:HIT family protein [Mycobacterium avium]|uniref:HIT family protein n=1 Tax=Mycobacterium avium TaxID=1764 RepID=UPI0007A0005C|nr:HIT domain-containing protein [Mycobacterium avium]